MKQNNRIPLLLLHGICNNYKIFSQPDGLGAHLMQHFDIYPVNYPIYEHRNLPFDFDFHLQQDIPVIWKQICKETGTRPAILGYSLGGILAMVAQARGIIDAPQVIAVGSPFRFFKIPLYPSLMRFAVKVSKITGHRTVPIKLSGRILGLVFTTFKLGRKPDDLALFRNLVKNACINVPVETLGQTLRWIRTTRLMNRDGSHCYLDDFADLKTPTCFIYGEKDIIAPESAAREGYLAAASRRKALYSIPEGTHLSMLVGNQAKSIAHMAYAWCSEDQG